MLEINTSAENIIIWKNKNGRYKLNDFTYNNIIGRGGRMFKHFVGQIYILDTPPTPVETSLDIELPEEIYIDVDERTFEQELTKEQVAKIIEKKEEMEMLLQIEDYDKFIEETPLQSANAKVIKDIVSDMLRNRDSWKGLNYLNSNDMNNWDRFLYKIINLQPDIWEEKFSNVVNFIKILSGNWQKTIPTLLDEMAEFDMGIDNFFKLERTVTFKMASLLGDVNILQKKLLSGASIDISPFIIKISNAFLPPAVYQLEEYGLPRMISRKIDNEKVFDFTNNSKTLHETIKVLKDIGYDNIIKTVSSLDEFDKYILKYFYDGI